MNIALIGATGNIGTEITKEALRRGVTITAIVRNRDKVPAASGLTAKAGDANNPAELTALLAGHDAVVSSVHFTGLNEEGLIQAVKDSGVPRFLVVGGAASLLLPDGTRVIDSPSFPDAYKTEASAGIKFYEALKAEPELNWTFLSPSAEIAPGERTEKFRLGTDHLLIGEDGRSFISQADYAIAFVDELLEPKHNRQRFTVGY